MLIPEMKMLWRYWIDLVGNKTGLILSVALACLITIFVVYEMLYHGVPWWWAVFVPSLYVSGWLDRWTYSSLREREHEHTNSKVL